MEPNVLRACEIYNAKLRANWGQFKADIPGLGAPPEVELLLERESLRITDAEATLFGAIGIRDLHFFSMFVLGMDRMTPPDGSHGELCRKLERKFDMPTFLMAHRSFFKSTIGAICRPLWGVVRDPEQYDHIHRVDDMDLGGEQLQTVAGHIDGDNPVFNRLYPDVKPKKNEWSPKTNHRLSVDLRRSTTMGPTFELRSTKMGMAGRHVRDMTYDDWVTEENCESASEQDRLFKAFFRAFPSIDTDNLLICGTPYTRYDCWSQVLKHYYPRKLRVMLYPLRGTAYVDERRQVVWEDTPEGEPHVYANPWEWDDDKHDHERDLMSPEPWYFDLQYYLATNKDFGGGFAGVQFEYATMEMLAFNDDNPLCFYTVSDPASGEGESRPATVIWAVRGTGEQIIWDAKVYDEETDMVDDLFVLWATLPGYVASMGVERMGHGGISCCREIERQCQVRGIYLPIEALTPQGESKDGRILATLRPKYRRKMVFHHPELRDGEYEREVLEFGRYAYKDMIDASAYVSALVDKYGYVLPDGRDTKDNKRSLAEAAGRHDTIGYTLQEMLDPANDGWDDEDPRGVGRHANAGSIL